MSRLYSQSQIDQLGRLLEGRRAADSRAGRPPRPVPALVIAHALRLAPDGKRETRRRRAREIVEQARNEGAPIASGPNGYWPAEEVQDLDATQRFLRRLGVGVLATASRLLRSPAAAAIRGQRSLPFVAAHAAHRGVSLSLYLTAAASGHKLDAPAPAASAAPETPTPWSAAQAAGRLF